MRSLFTGVKKKRNSWLLYHLQRKKAPKYRSEVFVGGVERIPFTSSVPSKALRHESCVRLEG